MRVEVLERQPAQLLVDLTSQAVDGPLRNAGHGVPGDPGEERGQEVERHQAEQDHRQRPEIDADAGDGVGGGDQVRQRVVCRAQAGDHLVVRRSGRQEPAQLLADEAVHELVDAVAQDLRSEDLTGGAE